ncbi:MAG: MOSC domain-containing protein, partial [Myxococcota bacterium]
VTLWPLIPASELDHYRRGQAVHDDMETELRAISGRTLEEPLPDLSTFPPEILHFASPPGTYFDAFPLLVMTSTSLATLQSKAPGSRFDIRRFRPNFLIGGADDSKPFPESEWCGKRLRMGDAEIEVVMDCPRCVMTTHGLDDLPKDPEIMRTLVREAGGNLGVYAKPIRAGRIQTGDAVELLTV